MSQKETSIETLRGIAVILMVAGHVIGHNDTSGMKVENDSLFRYFYYSLQYLRMPLFTVISGYVYSLRPFTISGNLFNFLNGKARRLLIPLIIVSTLQFFLRVFTPGVNNPKEISDIWRIYLFGFDQFWFLQAIFLVFITIALIEYFDLFHSVKSWLTILLISIVIRVLLPTVTFNIFSINGYFQLLPFFIFGCGLQRFSGFIFKKQFLLIYLFIFITSFTIAQIQWFAPFYDNKMLIRFLALTIGLTGISILFRFRFNQAYLAKIGYYSFSIYLFHVLGTSSSRLNFKFLYPGASPLLVFCVSLFFGILTPIIIELLVSKNKTLKLLFIGIKNNKTETKINSFTIEKKKKALAS